MTRSVPVVYSKKFFVCKYIRIHIKGLRRKGNMSSL
jgi:hypothetical protein